jgi:hypothetical protein
MFSCINHLNLFIVSVRAKSKEISAGQFSKSNLEELKK